QGVVDALGRGFARGVEEILAGEILVGGLLERRVARLLDAPSDLIHGPVEGLRLVPLGGARRAVPDLGDAVEVDRQLIGGGPLGAEGAAAHWAGGVALDVDDLAVQHADELPAANGAIGADAGDFARVGELEASGFVLGGAEVETQAHQAAQRKTSPNRSTQEITTVWGSGIGHDSPLTEAKTSS